MKLLCFIESTCYGFLQFFYLDFLMLLCFRSLIDNAPWASAGSMQEWGDVPTIKLTLLTPIIWPKRKLKLSPMFQEYVGTFWKTHTINPNVTVLLYLCVKLINNRLDTTLRFFFGPVYIYDMVSMDVEDAIELRTCSNQTT